MVGLPSWVSCCESIECLLVEEWVGPDIRVLLATSDTNVMIGSVVWLPGGVSPVEATIGLLVRLTVPGRHTLEHPLCVTALSRVRVTT